MTTRQSAANRVGAPAFTVPQSSRGRAIAAATGTPVVPQPTLVAPDAVSFNPDNPREEIGDVSDLVETLTEVGQITAITVATTEAYLANRPERRNELDDGAAYVVIDGHRRLKAVREAGLPTIKVMLGDEFASTDETLLEAAYIANARRKDLSELEDAQALQQLVQFYGSQHKAAKRLGISQPLISQKISLLSLTPELQADLEAGRRNVSHLRNMAKLPADQQKDEADRRARADSDKKKQRASSRGAAPRGDNSVITPAATTIRHPDTERTGDNSVITRETPGSTHSGEPHLSWTDPGALNKFLRERMTEEDRLTLAKLLGE
ncbi:ParB/RepB/Spo0J family partition protein [Streptomyces cinereoruber]|uniref:ParB/RepB/Spo0J family partition protein n=1 Tax=Streptomyces cinereoruber TaxID=67260 RepID=UPI0036622480